MKDETKFGEYTGLLSEKFGKEISQAYLKMIWESLRPFNDGDCERALKHVFLHGRFLKDLIPDLLQRLEGEAKDQAVLAWVAVDKAVKNHGPYASVKFDDLVIHSVINVMGGWGQFQDCSIKEWTWKQKEFEKLYPVIQRKNNHPEHLAGQIEMKNRSGGYDEFTNAPVQIGDNNQRLISGSREVCPACVKSPAAKNGLCDACHLKKHGF